MNQVEILLKDMTFNSRYEFLEESKKLDEVIEIAKKRGIKLPAHDLAPFKCVYAFTNRKNLNGCILPEEEVKKSLKTLAGKAIDFDHIRQRVVGHWIDAKLEKGTIVAYGVFYKGNFPEDYELIKQLMKKGRLKVSFEAWGDHNYYIDGSYDLTNIEFAGGGLLLTAKPAFKEAEVLEMANEIVNAQERILEIAKVCTEPSCYVIEESSYLCECIKCGYTVSSDTHCNQLTCKKCGSQMRRKSRPGPGRANKENAKLYFPDDSSLIWRILGEIKECPSCKIENPSLQVKSIDLDKDIVVASCYTCGAILKINLEPNVEITKKGKKIKGIEVEQPKEIAMIGFSEFLEDYKGEDYELIESFLNEDENESLEEAKKLSYEKRKKLPDDMFAVVITKKGKNGKTIKIRKYPLNDETRVRAALRYLGMPRNKKALEKLGVSVESVKRKIMKRAKELNMTELLKGNKEMEDEVMEEKIKELQAELAKVKEELAKKTEESEKATATINELKKESEDAKKKIEDIEKAKAEDIEKAKKEAKIVAERRAELADFAKDISDEDLLDDVKYENAKLKMELANKEKEIEVAKKGKPQDFTKGSRDKDTEDPVANANKKVRKYAWGV